MALGKIKADTLEHSTAGSLDTQYVVQGSTKAWVRFDQAGPTVQQSLNIASVTDSSAGKFITNFASNFSGANDYNFTGMSQTGSGTAYCVTIQMDGTPATGTCPYEQVFNNNTFSDRICGVNNNGDLA